MVKLSASYTTRKSLPFYRTGSQSFEGKHYLRMFQEDFSLSEFQYLDTGNLKVIYKGEEKEGERTKELLSQIAHESYLSRRELVCTAIHKIAQMIMHEGEVHYELCKSHENEGFLVHYVTPFRLIKLPFYYVQLPPQNNEYNKTKPIWLKKKNVWKVSFPPELGGSKHLKSTLKKLVEVGGLLPKGIDVLDQRNGRYAHSFDLMNFTASNELYILKVADKFGWMNRGYHSEMLTEYFVFNRMIQQNRIKIIFFNHILAEINLLLKSLSIDSEIIIEGLLTLERFDEIERHLHDGEITFLEAYKLSGVPTGST